MAGLDEAVSRRISFFRRIFSGYLAQEPELEAGKTVREIVEEGVQDVVDLQKEFDAINLKFGEE